MSDQQRGTVADYVAHQAGTLRQGDLLVDLAVAVTGLGPAPALPDGVGEGHETAAGELWTITFAPVVWLPQDRWREAASGSYTSRFFAIPQDALDGAPEGFAPVVDLAWQTSIAKGSLADGDLQVVHPLTGPHRRRFATWVGWRAARPPFCDDVVEAVLDPAHDVRSRLMRAYDKAVRSGAQPNLEASIRKRMQHQQPNSGFGVAVSVRSFSDLSAADAETFSLLMR